jgi:hypothetical protein
MVQLGLSGCLEMGAPLVPVAWHSLQTIPSVTLCGILGGPCLGADVDEV